MLEIKTISKYLQPALFCTVAALAACDEQTRGVGNELTDEPADELRTLEQDLLARINQRRSAVGCRPVIDDASLRAAAMRHARDMSQNPGVRESHTGSDGSSPKQRIVQAGFTPLARWGEIMYWGIGAPYNTVDKNIDWWLNSPGHRGHIENCEFTHAGVGLLNPGNEWYSVVDFGSHGIEAPQHSCWGPERNPSDNSPLDDTYPYGNVYCLARCSGSSSLVAAVPTPVSWQQADSNWCIEAGKSYCRRRRIRDRHGHGPRPGRLAGWCWGT